MQEQMIVGIDIGPSKFCVTVAALEEGGGARYVGHGSSPGDGISAGEIVDEVAFGDALERALDEARRFGAGAVHELYLSVSGAKLTAHQRDGRLDRSTTAAFTQADVMRALPDVSRFDARSQTTIHRVVEIIAVDGDEVDTPAGVRGRTLTVKTRDYTTSRALVDGVSSAAERLGCKVQAIVPAGVAAGAGALTDGEKQLGVAVVDLGYTSTDIAVYCAGALYGLTSIPLGGYHLTNDIAGMLDIPFADAERAKRVFGAANLLDGPELDLSARTIAGWQRQAIAGDPPREAVQTVAGARLMQIFSEVGVWLRDNNLRGSLLAGVVLTGGGARLAGIEETAGSVLRLDVRSGGVVAGDGFPAIPDASVTASVGLLRYCVSRSSRAAARRPTTHYDALGSTAGAPATWYGSEERVGATGLVNNSDHADARGWGRSVTRWMREFIPARGA